jgi:hypothetical protein
VIEGLNTVEVRWILPGQLDAAVAGWFGRFPATMDSREDAYLIHPVLRGLSVKIRAGRALEVKQFHGSPGILDAAGSIRGRMECWQKWSFPFGLLGPDEAGPPGWTVVHKRRRISRFPLAGGQLAAHVPQQGAEPACAVELTEVRSGGETWWSLGFEATGPADLTDSMLRGTAALVFTLALPGDVELGIGQCQSYNEWLSRRRIPAMTETAGFRLDESARRRGRPERPCEESPASCFARRRCG